MVEIREILKHRDADKALNVDGPLFHVTPRNRLDSIFDKGLEPRSENVQDQFPLRVYLAQTEDRAVKLAFDLRKAMVTHKRIAMTCNEDWIVLSVCPAPETPFWIDGYSQGGVYTDRRISPDRISIAMDIPGDALKSKNWPSFWDDYFWGEARRLAASKSSQHQTSHPHRMRM